MADRIPFLDRLRSEITTAIDRGHPSSAPAGGWRRAAALAIGAAVIVLAIVGIGALFDRDAEPPPAAVTTSTTVPPLATDPPAVTTPTTPPATTTPEPAPTTSSAPAPEPAPITEPEPSIWMRVPDLTGTFAEGDSTTVTGIVPIATGYLAWGSTQVGDTPSPTMWSSADGLVWQHVAVPQEPGAYVEDVAILGNRFVAVGGIDRAAAFWVGEAGAWRRVSPEAGLPGDDADLVRGRAVVETAGALVAVGSSFTGGGLGGGDTGAGVVWTSPDGISWAQVDTDVFAGPPGTQTDVTGVAADGRRVVMVGVESVDEEGSSQPRAWVSDDQGATWEAADVDQGDGDGFTAITGVAVSPQRFVAVGFDQYIGDAAAVWTSVTGRTWERVEHDEAVFGGGLDLSARMVAAGWADGRAFAIGNVRQGAAFTLGLWESADGVGWRRVAAPEGGWADAESIGFAVSGRPGRVVAAGATVGPGELPRAATWVSPPVELPDELPTTEPTLPPPSTTLGQGPPQPGAPEGSVQPSGGPSDTIITLWAFGFRDLPRNERGAIEIYLVNLEGERLTRVCTPRPDPFGQVNCVVRLAGAGELAPGTYEFEVSGFRITGARFVVSEG